MVSYLFAFTLATSSLISPSRASPVSIASVSLDRPSSSVAQCTPYTIPLNVTSQNIVFNITKFRNDLDLIDVATNIERKDSNVTFNPVGGVENVTAQYSISGTFCTPKNASGNGREKTVLLATQGIGYDGRYWDSAYKPREYSFVEAMVAEGYSVFYYDRLGTGKSQIVSGYTNQVSIQVEIAASLASSLRGGSYTGNIGTPKSIVLVGHSYGSLVSNNVIAKYPNLADAVVLTGFSFAPKPSYVSVFVAAATLRISSQHDPLRYGNLDTGYIGFADIAAQVNTFFKAPYELGTVEYADSISAPAAISEFLSQASLSLPLEFGKPVLVATGEFDLPFCGGECHSTYAEQQLNAVFPKSTLIDTFLHPGAGHGINFAENATGFYAGISGFLERAGF